MYKKSQNVSIHGVFKVTLGKSKGQALRHHNGTEGVRGEFSLILNKLWRSTANKLRNIGGSKP